MSTPHPNTSVVVGIDGSDAGIQAALWATDEAVSRDVPLRLVYAAYDEGIPGWPVDDFEQVFGYAEASLRAASAAVAATGKPVKVETVVANEPPDTVLIRESRHADLVCVGSEGIGRVAKMVLGSTAATVAENALCSVAIIRPHHNIAPARTGWVAVAVDGSADDDTVLRRALDEAALRAASVLAIRVEKDGVATTSSDEWERGLDVRRAHPAVRVESATTPDGVGRFLAGFDGPVQLAVLGARDIDELMSIIGPHGHGILPHARCSVLVVR
jgi:nucleotide-binding universal stress UspA family protein